MILVSNVVVSPSPRVSSRFWFTLRREICPPPPRSRRRSCIILGFSSFFSLFRNIRGLFSFWVLEMSSEFSEEILIDKLAELNSSQQSIESILFFFVFPQTKKTSNLFYQKLISCCSITFACFVSHCISDFLVIDPFWRSSFIASRF